MPTTDLRSLIIEATRTARLKGRGEKTPVRASVVLDLLGISSPPSLGAEPSNHRDPATNSASQSLVETLDRVPHGTVAVGRPVPEEPPAEGEGQAPQSISRFDLGGLIGEGAMGRVFSAFDPEIRRQAAIKVIRGDVTEARLKRFVAEAQICGQLEHPNIVPVYDVGVDDGQFYFVMKQVRGRSLHEVLVACRNGIEPIVSEWTRHRLLSGFVQVCNAVAYANSRRVLHRDLKPTNIMIGDFGEVLLMDWGVAGIMGHSGGAYSETTLERVKLTRTMDGCLVGTAGYMSPEQARGELKDLDERSDVWSLGAILYEILAQRRAFSGSNPFAVLVKAAAEAPPDPRERSPDLVIPAEIAEICNKALCLNREDRFRTAGDLASAVAAFLEGVHRRTEAQRRYAQAMEQLEALRALEADHNKLQEREADLAEKTAPWTPVSEKGELLLARSALDRMAEEIEASFENVVTVCDSALSLDPENQAIRHALAEVYWNRFEAAEARGDATLARHYVARVRVYDRGEYTLALQSGGRLSLQSDPPGARVSCQQVERQGLIWGLSEPWVLGETPLCEVPLQPGSYQLTISAPDRRDTVYPILISRNRHWDSGEEPIPLYSEAQIGSGFIYVPRGPFVCGGDRSASNPHPRHEPVVEGFFLNRRPVAMQEYCAFINILHAEDPERAWARVPRQGAGMKAGGQYWERPLEGKGYVIPKVDSDGDRWDPDWPVFGVSWHDAHAYVEWRSEVDGVTYGLPSDLEWEKAARGADGRAFPWGDRFDATLCKMRDSRAGSTVPEPIGTFATDRSIYGVGDMAGSMGELCSDNDFKGDATKCVVRGGGWSLGERNCRVAERYGVSKNFVISFIGLRLARRAPISRGTLR